MAYYRTKDLFPAFIQAANVFSKNLITAFKDANFELTEEARLVGLLRQTHETFMDIVSEGNIDDLIGESRHYRNFLIDLGEKAEANNLEKLGERISFSFRNMEDETQYKYFSLVNNSSASSAVLIEQKYPEFYALTQELNKSLPAHSNEHETALRAEPSQPEM